MDNNQYIQYNLNEVSNHELMRLYEQFEAGSADFIAVREEMIRRGFKFQNSEDVIQPLRDQTPATPKTLPYSKGWSAFWEFLFVLMGIVLFSVLMEMSDWEPSTQQGLIYGLCAFMVFSLGGLISGVRNLANHKTRLPEAVRSGTWQMILGMVWVLAGFVVLFMGIRSVSEAAEWSGKIAAYTGAVFVSICLICAAYAISLITLGKEMGSVD